MRRRSLLLSGVGILATKGGAAQEVAAPPAGYQAVQANARAATGVLTAKLSAPAAWSPSANLYIPILPTYLGQSAVFTRIAVQGSEAKQETYIEPTTRQEFALLRLSPANTQFDRGIRLRVEYQAQLWDTSLRRSQSRTPVEPDKTSFVGSTSTLDYEEPTFRTFLRDAGLQRKASEDGLAFVYRAARTMARRYAVTGSNIPDERRVSRTCGWDRLECNTASTLLCAVCRANGIPARLLNGRNTRPDPHPLGTHHFRAEVFIAGLGWLPLEVSGLLGQTDEQLVRSFGMIPKSLMVLAAGSDFRLRGPSGQEQTHQTASEVRALWSFTTAGNSIDWSRVRCDQNWSFSWAGA